MSDDEQDDSDVDDPGGPLPRVVLGAAFLESYVRGFPMHAAIVLRADPPGATLRLLPHPTLLSTADAVGFVVREAAREHIVAELRPRPVIAMDPGSPGLTLRPGEVYRTLVDLGPRWPRDLAMGRYRLSVVFTSGFGEEESEPRPIVFRDPTTEERRTLDTLSKELPRGATWSAWARAKAAEPQALRGPFSPADPLVYLRVLRWLLKGDDDLADIDPSMLDALPRIYAPEADVLRAELARARGDLPPMDSELQRENEARRERKSRAMRG